MTEQELEAATNPFANSVDTDGDGEISKEELDEAVDLLAGMEADLVIVDEDVSLDPKTDSGFEAGEVVTPVQDKGAVFIGGDPTFGLPHSAKLPEELTVAQMVRQAEVSTHVPIENIPSQNPEGEVKVVEDVDTTGMPTRKILAHIMPPSSDSANTTHTVDWARHCKEWAAGEGFHFLGLHPKSGEPLFKEKK